MAPRHRISCPLGIWEQLLKELAVRGEGHRESGAFLLGETDGQRRAVHQYALYDDLDPGCLESGIIRFDGRGYGALWAVCRQTGLRAVADVHTHPEAAIQSQPDRDHPMIAEAGHISIIVPNYARACFDVDELGIYRYRGQGAWDNWSGRQARCLLYSGRWA